MPSANKTQNYKLNQWQGNEYPKRADFVEDNQIIDTELKKAEEHRNTTNNPHKVTAAQVGALPAALKDVSGTITDFCQLITPGRYRMMNATANCPPGCTSGDNDYIVHVDNPVTVPANGYVIQMVYDIRSLSIWIHKCINGTWYWQKPDANSANFASGTVALTTPALRNTVISNVEPSGGSDGDTWDMY